MGLHLLDLLPEIREEIFSYCGKSDLVNFACCSKECYGELKYLLFREVTLKMDYHNSQKIHRKFKVCNYLDFGRDDNVK